MNSFPKLVCDQTTVSEGRHSFLNQLVPQFHANGWMFLEAFLALDDLKIDHESLSERQATLENPAQRASSK
jgi:hypothetical protein